MLSSSPSPIGAAIEWSVPCTREDSITVDHQDEGATKKNACVNVLAADMKGESHGFRNYSHCQQHALSWIHLFHRQPYLAYMTNDHRSTREVNQTEPQPGADTEQDVQSLTIHTLVVAMAVTLWGTACMAATVELSTLPVSQSEKETPTATAATSADRSGAAAV